MSILIGPNYEKCVLNFLLVALIPYHYRNDAFSSVVTSASKVNDILKMLITAGADGLITATEVQTIKEFFMAHVKITVEIAKAEREEASEAEAASEESPFAEYTVTYTEGGTEHISADTPITITVPAPHLRARNGPKLGPYVNTIMSFAALFENDATRAGHVFNLNLGSAIAQDNFEFMVQPVIRGFDHGSIFQSYQETLAQYEEAKEKGITSAFLEHTSEEITDISLTREQLEFLHDKQGSLRGLFEPLNKDFEGN